MDSSGWIEFFRRGPLGRRFRSYLDSGEAVTVPSIVIYEVYKVIRREASAKEADVAVARLKEHLVVSLDEKLATDAADVSLQYGLGMADAIVYATAQAYDALLVTGDRHFAGLPGVEVVAEA